MNVDWYRTSVTRCSILIAVFETFNVVKGDFYHWRKQLWARNDQSHSCDNKGYEQGLFNDQRSKYPNAIQVAQNSTNKRKPINGVEISRRRKMSSKPLL